MYKHISHFLNKLDEFYDPGKSEGYLDFVKVLASTLENDDHYTKGHSERVNEYALMMAEGLRLSEIDRNNLQVSAYLHDIGKVGMILKKDALDENEWAEMKDHPEKGTKMVSPLRLPNEVVAGIKYHHERMDGAGYPAGMKGKQIPLFARIIAIADAYDAITVGRPYKAALNKNDALLELEQNAGTQFDKVLVEIFATKMRKK
jgi:putative nucleotidyltransferase with HDIG domain